MLLLYSSCRPSFGGGRGRGRGRGEGDDGMATVAAVAGGGRWKHDMFEELVRRQETGADPEVRCGVLLQGVWQYALQGVWQYALREGGGGLLRGVPACGQRLLVLLLAAACLRAH
jgi:hypothetical protein